MSCGYVGTSTDGASYTDVSGSAMSISDTAQTRITGEAYTLTGDKAIVKGGKREPMEPTITIIYSETDAEAYEQMRLVHETDACGTDVYIQWSPRGNSADDELVTSDAGVISEWVYPPLDASGGGPIVVSFKVKTPGVTTTIVSS